MSEILIINDDEKAGQALQARLLTAGHHARYLSPKEDDLLATLAARPVDVLFLNPGFWEDPDRELPAFIKTLRRASLSYTYLCLTSPDMNREDAIRMGANTVLISEGAEESAARYDEIFAQAAFLRQLAERIGDDSIDFPSAGGVIARSAFNQLFLSAIDRANRYGEQTYILFFTLENYRELLELDGSYTAEYAVASLSKFLVDMRRQSDIIGQTAKNEFGLLLQRPMYESEPLEAANRFVKALAEHNPSLPSGESLKIVVTLVGLPTASTMLRENLVTYKGITAE